MLLHDLLVAMAATSPPDIGIDSSSNAEFSQPEATLTAGLIVFVGTVLAFVASILNRRSLDRATNLTHEREVRSDQQDRFTKIAEQLSKTEEPIQLAGVFGLSALADEWQATGNETQRNVCVELLCAFLRAHQRNDDSNAVHAALISVIKEHCQANATYPWPAPILNLSGADLRHADLKGVNFSGIKIDKATLSYANLEGASFRDTGLQDVNFYEARLNSVDFSSAFIIKSDFRLARLRQSNWTKAAVWGASFQEAKFHGAIFVGATMGVGEPEPDNRLIADFRGSILLGVDFSGANMAGSFFRFPGADTTTRFVARPALPRNDTASSSGYYSITQDATTRWPAGFCIEDVTANKRNPGESKRTSATGDSPG